jgi:hypothetical protein
VIAGKTMTCGILIAAILVTAGPVCVHYAKRIRTVHAVSELHGAHALARAWLIGQYAEHGVYPRELPTYIEYNGRLRPLPHHRHIRYDVSEHGERCELSWSVGSCACKETWENGHLTARITEGFSETDAAVTEP